MDAGDTETDTDADTEAEVVHCCALNCSKTFPKNTLALQRVVERDVERDVELVIVCDGASITKKEKKDRQPGICNVMKMVNALINSGGGLLYIHVGKKDMVHFLDEQLDDKLMKLIPDGSIFSEYYERKKVDEDHISLRVKPHNRPSTLDFKTKTSTDAGLTDPTHQQMQQFINAKRKKTSEEPPQPRSPLKDETLQEGVQLHMLNENTTVEVKSVCDFAGAAANVQLGAALVDYAWENLKLPDRITSFSKEPGGGLYILGIGEVVSNYAHVFQCEGVLLPGDQEQHLRDHLQQTIQKKMLWRRGPELLAEVSPVSQGQVEVSFRDIDQSQRRIVEMRVKPFHGLCFYDYQGPEAWEFRPPSNPDNSNLFRISCDDWLKQH